MASPSRSEAIARAVASDLTEHSSQFAYSFIARFDPMPERSLSDLRTLKLDVRDSGQRSLGRGARGHQDYEYAIEISSHIQLGDSLSQVLTRLKALAEQIADHFWFQSPTDCEETLDRVEVAEFGTDETLQQLGLGRMQMTLVFFGHRNSVAT